MSIFVGKLGFAMVNTGCCIGKCGESKAFERTRRDCPHGRERPDRAIDGICQYNINIQICFNILAKAKSGVKRPISQAPPTATGVPYVPRAIHTGD